MSLKVSLFRYFFVMLSVTPISILNTVNKMYYYVDIRWYGMTCKVDLHPSTSSPYLETFWEVHLLLTQPGAFPCTGGRCCHTETHKSDRRPSVPLLQHRRVTWQVIMSHHWLVWSISPGHTTLTGWGNVRRFESNFSHGFLAGKWNCLHYVCQTAESSLHHSTNILNWIKWNMIFI